MRLLVLVVESGANVGEEIRGVIWGILGFLARVPRALTGSGGGGRRGRALSVNINATAGVLVQLTDDGAVKKPVDGRIRPRSVRAAGLEQKGVDVHFLLADVREFLPGSHLEASVGGESLGESGEAANGAHLALGESLVVHHLRPDESNDARCERQTTASGQSWSGQTKVD